MSAGSYGQVMPERHTMLSVRKSTNLIDWIPMEKTIRCCEYHPECGALTGKLLEKAE